MDRVAYWQDIAQYDLDTADALFSTKRWLYVGFMCHQVLEKMLKAYWCKTQPEDPPYTHNLLKLAQGSGLIDAMGEERSSFLSEMLPLNIEARYPEYKERLMKQLSQEVCQNIITKTKEITQWIRQKL